MAVKTITIDLEAYDALARRKKLGQSFSQVIKEHFDTPRTGRDLAAVLRRVRIDVRTIDEVEAELRKRPRHRARAASL
jgi:predicted CopG family antitoxin